MDSREVHWKQAEKMTGRRLDRRRKYAVISGEVCNLGRWTEACSGCCPDDERWDGDTGVGCDECGYTGRTRASMWFPLSEEA